MEARDRRELNSLKKENRRLRMERETLKKSDGLLCAPIRQRHLFIRQQVEAYPVTALCRLLRVSRRGFYFFLKRAERPKVDAALVAALRAEFEESGGTYGSRRMSEKLRERGFEIGRNRARTLMRMLGLRAARRPLSRDNRQPVTLAPTAPKSG